MTKKSNHVKTGTSALAFALAFLFAANVQADITRGVQPDDMEAIYSFAIQKGAGNGNYQVDLRNYEGLTINNFSGGNGGNRTVSFDLPLGLNAFDGFDAVSGFTITYGDTLMTTPSITSADLTGLTIRNGGTTSLNGTGEFFAFIGLTGDETLSFSFTTANATTAGYYYFTFWGLPSGGDGNVPEPATLAIVGLGLAGLGLATRRKKKNSK